MTNLFRSLILTLISMSTIACVVAHDTDSLASKYNIDAKSLGDELELHARVLKVMNEQKSGNRVVKKVASAKGLVIGVIRGRAFRTTEMRSIFVLCENQSWLSILNGESQFFWVKMSEKDFLKKSISVNSQISVLQNGKIEQETNHRDYDLFYNPQIVEPV